MVSISYAVANSAPTITSGSSTQFPTGTASSFTVTTGAAEWPIPKITEVGSFPAGVKLTDHGDGTATLAGTPPGSAAGSYQFQVVASNGVAPQATQQFTLTVGAAPQITSANQTNWSMGVAGGSFTVTTTGDPTPTTITESGALPSGVSFQNNGDGTATFSGTPNENNGPVLGAYPITLTASQPGGSTWPAATQAFTIDVIALPQYVAFEVNSTGTDGTPLNPGFGLAVNQANCQNYISGAAILIQCIPGGGVGLSFGNLFQEGPLIGGRSCESDDLPLQTTLALAPCWGVNGLAWDPADQVALFAPATTTAGTTSYTFDHWDTSGQALGCDGGNTSTLCTFLVPRTGINITAVYTPTG